MSKYAVIPWGEEFFNDEMLNKNSLKNRDYLIHPYDEMKQRFIELGHEIHTIDMYDDYNEIDYFLFFSLDCKVFKKIVKEGKTNRMVYCTAEPPSVCKYNSPKGYKVLRKVFPYILTWNDEWIDEISIFKRNIPYWFVDQRENNQPFEDKKLLVCISGNKQSDFKGELYSERLRAIEFFEEKCPSEFDLYGVGWESEKHISYRGRVNNKAETYHKYRFAICYENIEGLKGYITEKIFDCLLSGVVPIYAGSVDASDYIPSGSYINLRDYSSYSELYEYISKISEKEYNTYLDNANNFLKSDKLEYFSGKKYADYIIRAVSNKKESFRYSKLSYYIYRYLLKHIIRN